MKHASAYRYMNFISPNTAAQYNIERKIEIQNIQVIQKKWVMRVITFMLKGATSSGFVAGSGRQRVVKFGL